MFGSKGCFRSPFHGGVGTGLLVVGLGPPGVRKYGVITCYVSTGSESEGN